MSKIKIEHAVKVPYVKLDKETGKPVVKMPVDAIVQITEDMLPPITEDERKLGGRLLTEYFKAAIAILEDEFGPVFIYQNSMEYLGTTTIVLKD